MMSFKQIIFQNAKGNLKNYSLYVFALTVSVALYFSFVTLQYDPAMNEMKETINGAATIQASSIFLILIVAVFILYANSLFLKRRSREIGLYQLIGMTKGKIWWVLSVENFILYIGSLITGVFIGFSISKLTMMILFKIIDVEAMTTLRFSSEALIQTGCIFTLMYLFILLMNYAFIRRQNIISLFHASSTTEEQTQNISVLTIISGIIGTCLLIFGYVLSSRLFSGDFAGNSLFYAMFAILASIIIGTYLFYKNSIRLFLHINRKRKDGYLSLDNVLSLSAIMFRMKSNAFLLTVITIISATAIALSSLSYIAYHSAEKTVEQMIPNHFSIFETKEAKVFTAKLAENKIAYTVNKIPVLSTYVDVTEALVPGSYDNLDISEDPRLALKVISNRSIDHIKVSIDEAVLTKPADALEAMLDFKDIGNVTLIGKEHLTTMHYIDMEEESVLPTRLTDGFPVVIVHEKVYEQLANDADTSIQNEFPLYIGIDIQQASRLNEANDIFHELELNKWTGKWVGFESQLEIIAFQKQGMGLTIFVAGFLGLVFLITSGCILYFKQIDESEEEKENYTILRKLGFTEDDLLRGIRKKQLFNFGIPLVVGLLHSYFAVKSGWFIFGKEMWTPMLIVMLIYTALYSVFGLLSVGYYKRVIKEAL